MRLISLAVAAALALTACGQKPTEAPTDGEAVDLFQERAASGLWYRASGYELRGEGVMARWTADGREPTDCRAVD